MTRPGGALVLVPNTLDFGVHTEAPDLQEVLPLGVIRIAATLTHWVAENAKTTRAFLKRVDAVVPLAQTLQSLSIVELPRAPKGNQPIPEAGLLPLLDPARAGHDIGLISEAGLPAVADPGAALVRTAHVAGIKVMTLPGPSAIVLAVAASGLNGQSFAFSGYLPVDAKQRAARIQELEATSRRLGQTQVVIETPYRNQALLAALSAHLQPGTWLSVSCGLTLPSGFTRSDTVAKWRLAPLQMPADVPAMFALLGS
ncbi:MAG: SAM-dependent methyltransferase [Rhizobacter sp.]|nr:SAM-dependent methyltransferase [Rhizobacter sp.]